MIGHLSTRLGVLIGVCSLSTGGPPPYQKPVSVMPSDMPSFFSQTPADAFTWDQNRCTQGQNPAVFGTSGVEITVRPQGPDCSGAEIRSNGLFYPIGTFCSQILAYGQVDTQLVTAPLGMVGSVVGNFLISMWQYQNWQHREFDFPEIYHNPTLGIWTNYIHRNPGPYFQNYYRVGSYLPGAVVNSCLSIFQNPQSPSGMSARYSVNENQRNYDIPVGRIPDQFLQYRFNIYSPKGWADDRLLEQPVRAELRQFCYDPDPKVATCLVSPPAAVPNQQTSSALSMVQSSSVAERNTSGTVSVHTSRIPVDSSGPELSTHTITELRTSFDGTAWTKSAIADNRSKWGDLISSSQMPTGSIPTFSAQSTESSPPLTSLLQVTNSTRFYERFETIAKSTYELITEPLTEPLTEPQIIDKMVRNKSGSPSPLTNFILPPVAVSDTPSILPMLTAVVEATDVQTKSASLDLILGLSIGIGLPLFMIILVFFYRTFYRSDQLMPDNSEPFSSRKKSPPPRRDSTGQYIEIAPGLPPIFRYRK